VTRSWSGENKTTTLLSSLVTGLSGSIEIAVFYGTAPRKACALLPAEQEVWLWSLAGARGLSLMASLVSEV
jgi:hypothetical protein